MTTMLDTLLKVAEFLNKILTKTPDEKRAELARELARVHLAIKSVAKYGRRIMDLREQNSKPGVELDLLSKQVGALDALRRALKAPKLAEMLDIHIPSAAQEIRVQRALKEKRVWFRLDQLVADGKIVKSSDWVQNMEQRWGSRISDMRKLPTGERGRAHHRKRPNPEISISASDEDFAKGQDILAKLDAAAETLRLFIVEKFKIEDTL
jgi:hypothetical protein